MKKIKAKAVAFKPCKKGDGMQQRVEPGCQQKHMVHQQGAQQ